MEPLIVYIIGDNRSGSTLLDYLLSKHPNAYSLGEAHNLYDYYYKIGAGIIYDWKCSCGKTVKECSFWGSMIEAVPFSPNYKTRLKPAFLGKRSLLMPKSQEKALNALIHDQTIITEGKEVTENCWKIYDAAINKTQKRIIIDSSKDPIEAYFRYRFRQGEIKFLLLERNVKAVAYSNMNRTNALSEEEKRFLKTREKSVYKYLVSRYMNVLKNRFLAKIIQDQSGATIVKKVNYLDLTSNPSSTIKDICTFLNIEDFDPPLVTNQYDEVPHILGGSPSRYERRPIQPDFRWRSYYKRKVGARVVGNFLQNICK